MVKRGLLSVNGTIFLFRNVQTFLRWKKCTEKNRLCLGSIISPRMTIVRWTSVGACNGMGVPRYGREWTDVRSNSKKQESSGEDEAMSKTQAAGLEKKIREKEVWYGGVLMVETVQLMMRVFVFIIVVRARLAGTEREWVYTHSRRLSTKFNFAPLLLSLSLSVSAHIISIGKCEFLFGFFFSFHFHHSPLISFVLHSFLLLVPPSHHALAIWFWYFSFLFFSFEQHTFGVLWMRRWLKKEANIRFEDFSVSKKKTECWWWVG